MARGEPLIRQWNLLKALQTNRFGLSAEELAERLECSTRQVRRDLAMLQQVGFPVHHDDRDSGKRFWRVDSKVIDGQGLMLSVTEMVSLFVSQQFLTPLAGTQFGDGLGSALAKIKAMLPGKALAHFQTLDETLVVRMATRHDYSGQDKELRLLNQAIPECRALKLLYHSSSQNRDIETEFHPYGLVFHGASLYCMGQMVEYGEIRTLKVDRIRSLEPTGRTFQRPADFSLKAYLDGSFGVFTPGKLQSVEARFTGWAATNVREQQWHASQKIVHDGKDGVVARFELSNLTEFKRWMLGFGPKAVVLKPASLADEIAADLASAHSAYRARPS